MKNRAAAYLRSSKDRSDVSIDAQRRALHELAIARSLSIVEEFSDAVESGKDDDRAGFQQLLRAVRQKRFDWIIALDTSRIARRRHLALIFEHECEKAKVRVLYKNVPADTDPITEMLLKSILQAMDEWHSLTSRAKGLAGMAENVRQGWRAGGRAPRGYKLEHHPTGAIRDGEPVMKSRLALDDEAAPLMRLYLRARAEGKSRARALQLSGMDIPTATLIGIEWQALTYAGHTVWNVHSEVTKDGYAGGTKRRPREEWIVKEDTHPALITTEEAETILRIVSRGAEQRATMRDHTYLLAGLLQTPDGGSWSGDQGSYYRVGSRGPRVLCRRVDDAILERLDGDLQSDETVDRIIRSMRNLVEEPADGRTIAATQKKIQSLDGKISALIDVIAESEPGSSGAYRRQVAAYEAQRAALVSEVEEMQASRSRASQAAQITPDAVRGMLTTVLREIREQPTEQQRVAISTLVDKIELDPDTLACRMHYRIEGGNSLASRRGCNVIPVVEWTARVVLADAARGRVRKAA
jgi:site-specific DNA recombinase